MNVGARGIALIKEFEQCRLIAYSDQRGIPTIGWGHTGPDVYLGLVWTQTQADARLVADLQRAVTGVLRDLDVAVSQNQFDALVSFGFNIGVSAEAKSTLIKLVNQSKWQAAADEFLIWDHVDGQENAGLERRRAAERALFLEPV